MAVPISGPPFFVGKVRNKDCNMIYLSTSVDGNRIRQRTFRQPVESNIFPPVAEGFLFFTIRLEQWFWVTPL